MALTDTKLQRLQANERAYQLADGGGLYVEVQPSANQMAVKTRNAINRRFPNAIARDKPRFIATARSRDVALFQQESSRGIPHASIRR